MKTYTFKIGGRDVTVTAVRDQENKALIRFCATCEDYVRNSSENLYPNPKQSKEQIEKDIKSHAEKLARKTAGKKQSESLIDSIFSG